MSPTLVITPNKSRNSLARLACVVLVSAGAAAVSFAQTAVSWTSTSDTTFSNGANWNGGVAPPDSLTTHYGDFDGASLADPVITTSQSVVGLNFANKAFTLSSTNGAVLTVGALGLRQNNNFDLTVNMDIILGADQSWFSQSSGGFLTMNGNVSGGFSFSKTGSGTVLLSGTNTYTGTTTVTTGILQFGKTSALYNGATASWTAANLIVESGRTLAFSVGGTGEFTTGNVTTLLTNLSTVNSNGLKSGSSIGFDTTNASGGTFTVADTIANSTGTGGGAIGVNKLGSGTLVLTGTNTYTGKTTISAGTLSISSIADKGSASSIGAPTTTLNSTIAIGSNTLNGTLLYTGGAASTNRVINLAGTTGGATIDSSGTGALTFTGTTSGNTITATGAGAKTLTLTGTTFGNTITGGIVDNSSTNKTSLTKSGSGSWILSGVNTYTGTTTISAGTLVLDATGTIANSTTINLGTTGSPGTLDLTAKSAFTFGSTQTVSGVGTINIGSGKTLTVDGAFSPGNSTGIVNVTGDLTFSGTTITTMEISGAGGVAGTDFDQINVSGIFTTGGTLNITSLGGFNPTAISSFQLFSSLTSIGGSFSTINFIGFGPGVTFDTSELNSTGLLNVTAIPELSTFAALAGLCVLGFVACRRRRLSTLC